MTDAGAPRVSVVMPVLNVERFLAEALTSILDQTFTDFELVVVDDGSTDSSPAILEQFALRDPRLRVVRQEQAGLTPALNRGWRLARAPYIARMDGDDVALPDRLERQVVFLDGHPRVGVVGGAFVVLTELGERLGTITYSTADRELRRDLQRYNCIPHPTAMIRREALERVGGYRLERAEDYDLWLRIAEDWEIANLPEPVLLYRHHPRQYSVAHLDRQAAGALAARAAARLRADGLDDPIPSGGQITPSLLRQLGIDDAAVERAVLADGLQWASILAETGSEDEAVELLRSLEGRATVGERAFRAAMRIRRAKAAVRAGRPVRAAGFVVGALAAQPAAAVAEAAALFRVRARSAGAAVLRRRESL